MGHSLGRLSSFAWFVYLTFVPLGNSNHGKKTSSIEPNQEVEPIAKP